MPRTYRRLDGGCVSTVLGIIDGMGIWIEARWTEHGNDRMNRTVVSPAYFARRYGVAASEIV